MTTDGYPINMNSINRKDAKDAKLGKPVTSTEVPD